MSRRHSSEPNFVGGASRLFEEHKPNENTGTQSSYTTLHMYLTKDMFENSDAMNRGIIDPEFPALVEQNPRIATGLSRVMQNLYRKIGSDCDWKKRAEWSRENWEDYMKEEGVHTYFFMDQNAVNLGSAQMKIFVAGERNSYPNYILSPKKYAYIHHSGILPQHRDNLGGQLTRKFVMAAFEKGVEVVTFETTSLDKNNNGINPKRTYEFHGSEIYREIVHNDSGDHDINEDKHVSDEDESDYDIDQQLSGMWGW